MVNYKIMLNSNHKTMLKYTTIWNYGFKKTKMKLY